MQRHLLVLLLGLLFAGAAQAQFLPGEDSFANATVLPAEGSRSGATNLNACTLEPGEVLGVSNMLPNTAWWRWTAAEDGYCVVDTVVNSVVLADNAKPFSELAVFTGESVDNLTKVAQGGAYRAFSDSTKLGSALRFFAQKGRTYSIQVGATLLSGTVRNVALSLRPLPSKSITREAVWTYSTEAGVLDVGAVTIMQNVNGTLSGKVRLRSGTYPFTGILDQLGMARVGVTEKQKKGELPRGPIILNFEGFKDGRLSVAFPSGFLALVFLYDSLPLEPVPTGNWTGTMTNVGVDHVGIGSVSMKVSASQSASVALRFFDGTVATHSGRFMSSDFGVNPSGLAMMKFLSGGRSAFQASGAFNNGPAFAFSGSGRYIRQEKPGAAFYPLGISTVMSVNAFPYAKPAAGQRALGFLNELDGAAVLRVTDPNNELGGNVDLPLKLETNNKFVFTTDLARKPVLTLNATTGQVTGSVILGGKKRSLFGTLSNPSAPVLKGYVTGTNENVKFEVLAP